MTNSQQLIATNNTKDSCYALLVQQFKKLEQENVLIKASVNQLKGKHDM